MEPASAYAAGLALLACWGAFTTQQLTRADHPWSWRRCYRVFVDLVFTAGAGICAAALATNRFAAWLLLPVGASYAAMIPISCYLEVVNRVEWIHATRNCVFAFIACACCAFGLGFLPLRLLGL